MNCACPWEAQVSGSAQIVRIEVPCERPDGHGGEHRVRGIHWGPVVWVEKDRDGKVIIEAERTIRAAERAVRRTRGAKG